MWRRLLPRLEAISLGVWIGSVLFFTVVVAPTAFTRLESPHSGAFLRAAFPKFYLFTFVCAAVTVALALLARWAMRNWGPVAWLTIGLLTMMTVATGIARVELLPRMEVTRRMREQAPPGSDDWKRADQYFKANHRLATLLNGIVLVTGTALFFVAPLPKGSGGSESS